jgi:hypothetical protein
MSKLGLLFFGILIIPLILLVGCSSNSSPEVQASTGQDFTLSVGQTAVISGEDFSIKFEAVSNDSRCPRGAQCIRAGEAVARVSLTQSNNSTPSVLELTEPGLTSDTHQTTWTSRFGNVMRQYTIKFVIDPYPEINKQIAPGDYKLQLNITRSL